MFDSLPDGFLSDGLLIFGGPDGGHAAMGFEIEMPNLQSASFADCNAAQDAVSAVLRQLPEGWKLQVRQFQTATDRSRLLAYQEQTELCRNETSRLLRNSNFIHLCGLRAEGRLLSKRVVVYVGHTLEAARAVPWKRAEAEQHYTQRLTETRAGFEPFRQALQQALAPVGGRIIPLADADNARLWRDALNPSLARQASDDGVDWFNPNRSLHDNFFNSQLRGRASMGFVLDGWHHLALTVRRLPAETYPTIIHRITYLPFADFNFTVLLHRLPKEELLKQTQMTLDRLHQQLLRRPDERQAVNLRQLQDMVRRLASGEAVPFKIEIIFLLRAKSEQELAEKAAAIKGALHGLNGCQYYEATLSATSRQLFAKDLPGWTGSRHEGYQLYCEDRSASDLLPFGAGFAGHPGPVEALFPGNDNNLVNIVTFLGEGGAATPQNFIVLGAPGAGKSLVVGKLLGETTLFYAFVAIVEEGMSQAPFTRSHGVEPIVFRLDGTQTMNPFDTYGLPQSAFALSSMTSCVARMVGLPADEDKARRQAALISKHLARLCDAHAEDKLRDWPLARRQELLRHALALHRLAGQLCQSDLEAFVEFSDRRREDPAATAKLLASFTPAELDQFESVHRDKLHNLVFAYLDRDEHLTLSSLREHLELADENEEDCRWLATLLTPWCRGGNYGSLFDGASNVTLNSPVVHFELGFIPEAAREIKAVAGFLIINTIRNHVLGLPRQLRKRVVIEEVSRFIDVPGGEAILRELFEQFRKFNVQVIIVAQQYSRIADTSVRSALVGNARAWLIFNTGDRRDIERLCGDLGLPHMAREAIMRFPRPDQQTGTKYSEFLYVHTDARQAICGTVRYLRLPHELPANPSHYNPTPINHA